jgi:hypothetical protein
MKLLLNTDVIKLTLLIGAIIATHCSSAQNVGIGTVAPQKKLTVNGSIMLDQGNQNNGTLDTAALLFGNTGTVGINSRKIGSGANGLSFWTGGLANFNIASNGNVGIGGDASALHKLRVYNGASYFEGNVHSEGSLTAQNWSAIGGALDPAYRLRVYDGNSRFGGDLHATGNVTIGGEVDPAYRLRIIGGNSRFGGDFHATGNAGIGGDVDPAWRLRVWGGNSRFGGDVQVTGDLSTTGLTASSIATNSMTIDGKGSVRSAGPSSLRIGFSQVSVNEALGVNGTAAVLANITEFSGDNDDVRVFVSQFLGDVGGSLSWSQIGVTVATPNAATDQVLVWVHNRSGQAGLLKGTIYLTVIAKN